MILLTMTTFLTITMMMMTMMMAMDAMTYFEGVLGNDAVLAAARGVVAFCDPLVLGGDVDAGDSRGNELTCSDSDRGKLSQPT